MNNTDFTVDIKTLLRILQKYAAIIAAVTIAATFAAFVMSEFVLPKKYSASAKFYIENSRTQSEIVNIQDINAARNMVNTCAELFTTRDVAERLKTEANLPYSVNEIMDMINMGTSANTEFLRVSITAASPRMAVYMLEWFVSICAEEFDRIIESGRISLVDSPYSTGKAVFPDTILFLILGFFVGFVLTYLIVFVKEILDIKVKAEDDLFTIYDIPVFAEVMCFDVKVKGEYSYE
ncbi:MAG: Wzz/FepE/Etk N-terminal domain-containing protein [Oscillospiraceae bacterium]|nr:Wzz/FepE/Etk N-terminal domain-containing protein [Oscillospiraceae bacterium]